MIRHDKIAKHPRLFKTLTGLSTEGFRQLLPAFERAWEAELDRRDAGRLRRRRRGGGSGGCAALGFCRQQGLTASVRPRWPA